MADGAGQSISSSTCFIRRKAVNAVAFRRTGCVVGIIVYKKQSHCVLLFASGFAERNAKNASHNKKRTALMSALTLKVAVNLTGQALATGREISAAPQTIADRKNVV